MIVGLPFVASDIESNIETIPEDMINFLCSPDDEEGAIEKILEIKNSSELTHFLKLSSWAKDKYNPKKLFDKFYDEL